MRPRKSLSDDDAGVRHAFNVAYAELQVTKWALAVS